MVLATLLCFSTRCFSTPPSCGSEHLPVMHVHWTPKLKSYAFGWKNNFKVAEKFHFLRMLKLFFHFWEKKVKFCNSQSQNLKNVCISSNGIDESVFIKFFLSNFDKNLISLSITTLLLWVRSSTWPYNNELEILLSPKHASNPYSIWSIHSGLPSSIKAHCW